MMFDDGKAKLTYAAKKLWLRWEQAQTQWNDRVTRDFEREHLLPLEPKLADALQAINRLAELFAKAEHDCRRS